MAILTIRRCTDPMLRKTSLPVQDPAEVWTLAADMVATMRAYGGAGLAAVQVGQLKRLFVMADLPEAPGPAGPPGTEIVVINPEITATAGLIHFVEGCLSMPGVSFPVPRFEAVTVAYTQPNGAAAEMTARGYRAVCLQHEIDHLNGVRNLDYLSPMQREKYLRKSAKLGRRR